MTNNTRYLCLAWPNPSHISGQPLVLCPFLRGFIFWVLGLGLGHLVACRIHSPSDLMWGCMFVFKTGGHGGHGRLGSLSSAAFWQFIDVGAFDPRYPFSSKLNAHLALVGFGFRWRRCRCLGVSTGESPQATRGVHSFYQPLSRSTLTRSLTTEDGGSVSPLLVMNLSSLTYLESLMAGLSVL